MKRIPVKTRWLIFALVSFLISWGCFVFYFSNNVSKIEQQLQKRFSQLERQQLNLKDSLTLKLKQPIGKLWKNKELRKGNFQIYIFSGDSLVFWNSNKLAIQKSLSNGYNHYIGHFANGYYLVDKFHANNYTILLASLINSDYFYQNNSLQNKLNPTLGISNSIKINWEKTSQNFPLKAKDGAILCFVQILAQKSSTYTQQFFTYLFYLLGIVGLLMAITLFLIPFAKKNKLVILVYPLFLLFLRYSAIHWNWLSLFERFHLFDPSLYASNWWQPSLGSLCLSLVFVFFIIGWITYFINKLRQEKQRYIALFAYILSLFYAAFVFYIFRSLILNSSIPLVVDNIFSLNLYSFLGLLIIAVLFLFYYFLLKETVKSLVATFSRLVLFIIWSVTGILFTLLCLYLLQSSWIVVVWTLIFNAFFFLMAYQANAFRKVKYHLVILALFALYGALVLYKNNLINEHQKRALYATQLISDQDPQMEVEFAATMKKLSNSAEFHQIIKEKGFFSAPNFSLQIENCCFDDFWERYEMSFFFFHADGSPLVNFLSNRSQSQKEIKHIIQKHTVPSTIAKDLYFVNDYFDRLSYIGHHTIKNPDGTTLEFYILFRSKKIPEQIGFPRLLMNKKSYVLAYLKDYSIARYSRGKLVMQFGSFNYPIAIHTLGKNAVKQARFFNRKGMNHYVLHQGKNQIVVISKHQKTILEQLSTFSYLFFFFGLCTVVLLLFTKWKILLTFTSIPLSLRIQIVLIGMVVGAFVIFAWIAVSNIKARYENYAQNNLKEKLTAVETEVNQTIEGRSESFTISDKDYFDFFAKQLAATFGSDINFYGLSGNLVATSQPKLYEKGIGAPIMNSAAYYALHNRRRSEFIHLENFGKLTFYSGYIPFRNAERKLLGYINLQHFSKQNVFTNQLNNFVVAVINLAVLFLVITIVIALFVSRWITAPLRLIQESIGSMVFGKENKPIPYKGVDEIGALVKEYNDKLLELELKAMQLAKSERENAWREMAKQVAHEIKNPLTPMRLSIQHFQRSFDPIDINAKEKLGRITASLIEQIDALTKIANEFSNFAKMPKPNEERLDVAELIRRTIDIYTGENIKIQLAFSPSFQCLVYADKNLLIRVFNNLIKNALQAPYENRSLQMIIDIKIDKDQVLLSFKDNGKGIPKDIQGKIFVPNFTTKTTGSGLGLAMVKQIILNHNGEIWFETEEGIGTTFYIRFPRILET